MCQQWKSDWSRHYDQIQWTATTLFTAAITILLTYAYSQKSSNSLNPTWVGQLPMFVGLWLTWVTVYYAAIFRELRRLLHESLPEGEEKNFLMNKRTFKGKRKLKQWHFFLATLALLTAAWLVLIWVNGFHCIAIVLGTASIAIFAILYWQGKL